MATTLRLGKSHYEALLPQLEEMGWSSADAHQALQATGARDLASAIDWLVARPASGEGGVVEPTPYQAPPAVVVPVPASSSLSAPSAALAPVAPAGGAEKSEYERKQRELELRKAREEKRRKEEEQRRIKEHIKDMKLDRARKYNRGGGATTGRAPVPTASGSAPSTPTPASASAASSSPVALLQIRLPTGTTVKHEFASTDTLGAVYEFVSQSTGRDVANFLLLQPGIPKVEYPIETALTTTLAQAELVPRGSITVMNREDKGVVRGAEAEPAMHFRRVRYRHAGDDDDEDEGELNADAVDTDAMSYEQLLALEERIGEVGKGLSKQVLATLPTFTYDSSVSVLGDPMCAFCLSDYDTGNILRKLPCGHAFHKECVDEWLKSRKTCPTCKQRIDDL